MGSRSSNWEEGGAEPDLSWMSFSPEAHGLKPVLKVWSSRSNQDNNYNNPSIPDTQQQEEYEEVQKKQQQKEKKNRFGIGKGRGKSLRLSDESDYEWVEEEILEEEEEVEEEPLRRRRRDGRGDRGKEQVRKVREDFDRKEEFDHGNGDGGVSSFGGRRRPPSASLRETQRRDRQQKSWVQSVDEDDAAAHVPWSTSFSKSLQFAAMVASCACLVAVASTVVLLYLSFGVTARPPSSCEVEKVVLDFSVQRIRLRGGRYISFREQGVGADGAEHSLLIVHDLLSSRLAGIPGISESLLREFGVRLIAYDRPGYGQSDPHLGRSYNSSAQDMADIADALGLGDKFWVAGFGGGGPHVWAAVNYIPERLAGVALFAPAGNFYAENMTKDEVSETWGLLSLRQKWMYSVARLFPALLPSLLQKTLFDHNPSPIRTMGGLAVGYKDEVLMEKEEILDFWERDMTEGLPQRCAFPVAEELILLVNNWGFSLANLPFNEIEVKTLLQQVVGLFQAKEQKQRIFSGPIHIWQGTDDQHVPATFNEYAKRMIEINDFSMKADHPVNLHILEGEGHFSWFWFCDECHRFIFNELFQPRAVSGPYGRQVFSAEEYDAILAAFGGSKERVDKLKKTEEAVEAILSGFGGSKVRVDKLRKTEEAREAILSGFGGSKERVDKLKKTEEAREAILSAFGGSKERVDKLRKTEEVREAILSAFGGSKERVDKLKKTEEARDEILSAFGGSKERVDKLRKTEEAREAILAAFGGSKARVDKLKETEEAREAILAAFGGSKERAEKLTKTEEAREAILAAFGGSKKRAEKLTKTEEANEAFFEAFGGSKERVDKLKKAEEAHEAILAILAALGGSKEMEKVSKTEEAPVTFATNVERAADGVLYRDTDSEEARATGIQLYAPESCDVPIDLSAFIVKAIDERIKRYFKEGKWTLLPR